MTTSVKHSLKRRTPAPRTVVRMFLMAGISYSVLPSVSAHAQTTTTPAKHTAAHKSAAKKKASAKQAIPAKTTPVAAPAATTAAPAATATTPVTQSNATLIQGTQAPATAETVTVTGTRLSQTRLTNVMAGSTVDAEQLAARGYTNLGLALLRENPAFSTPSNSQIGTQGSFGAGQTFSALFNLGDQRTLTLINGMRMVGGATASIFGAGSGSQVDVGTIPTSLVKKIDTKYGGAGASYGADAVAGVVNYQLDDHFTGVDFNAQGNWTQKLDAPQEKIYFKAGTEFDHGKGGVVFDVEYRNSGGVLSNARPNLFGTNRTTYSHNVVGTAKPYAYSNVLTQDRRYVQSAVTGMPMTSGEAGTYPSYLGETWNGVSAGNGMGAMMFTPNGQGLTPVTANSLLVDNYYGLGGNGISLANYNQVFTPSDSLNLTTLGHYDFTDHLHATWQGWYQRGSAKSLVAQGTWSDTGFQGPLTMDSYLNGDPASGYTDVNGPLTLSTSNPFLSSSARSSIVSALQAAGQPTDTFYMNRLEQDLDAGMFETTDQMFRFQGGLNGDFDALGRHFDWKVNGEYSRYLNDTRESQINTQNLINALDATTDSSGNIVCAPGYTNSKAATLSETCSPLNPFGYNQMTPASKDYVTSISNAHNRNTQRDLQAEISSTVVRLPAGDVRWDIGYEHRREGYNFDPGSFGRGELQDDGSYRRYGTSAPITSVQGSYLTHEVFGELDIPLVSPKMHVAGIYNLSATASGRYINNSVTGSYWTYMFGGSWWPTQDFGLSGNYAQSVRNPSVEELFAPQGTVYDSASDPCSYEYRSSGPNPAIRAANCAKEGIPSNFESQVVNQTMPGSSGGNRHLGNETSHSYTGTLELRPHFIPGFDMTASFVDVKIGNEISTLGLDDLMSSCYDSSSYPNNEYCKAFQRDPTTHQITNFQEGPYNIANQHMQSLVAHLDYMIPLRRLGLPASAGAFEISGNYNHYLKNQQNLLGNIYYGYGTMDQPQDNFTLNANYTRGPLFVQWQTIYYGKSKYATQVSATAYQNLARPDFAYFNTTIGYKVTKNFDINFMMNNVTNALPKYPGTANLTRYYEVLMGRSFQMSIGAHF